MSLEIVKQVHAKYPHLLAENTGYTCYWFLEHLIEHLRAADHMAYLVCKTQGEQGKYIPEGFQSRDVKGLDGKTYRCVGVSHDAVWCDGKQFDAIVSANYTDQPLVEHGRRKHASPRWHEVAEGDIRPWNPPLKERNTTIPPSVPKILPKGEAFAALQALNTFYQAPEGLQRPGGLVIPDGEGRSVADMEAIAQWFYQLVIEGVPLEAVFAQIRNSHEWKEKHGQL